MERLWSLAVATSGNRSQMAKPRKRLRQAKTVAVGCDRLRIGAHGKEGVDGSSPSEGSAKAPQSGAFLLASTCTVSSVRWVWSRLWSYPRFENARVWPRRPPIRKLRGEHHAHGGLLLRRDVHRLFDLG
jgi:hypothetical protein